MQNFEDTVAGALGDFPPGTICLASVSGGADSTAMLLALVALRDRGSAFQLRCIHIEHGIRPKVESRGDAEFVRCLCKRLRVPCRVVAVPPGAIAAAARVRGIGIEAAARLYRRRAWLREVRRIKAAHPQPVRLLTAHTADDMLETVLMRILRGAGPAGLAAMPARRGRIVRPLLNLNRVNVIRYLAEHNYSWQEDTTNTDIRFFRNRVRHRLIPLLDASFPHWRTSLTAFAATQSLSAAFIRDEAKRRVHWQPLHHHSASPLRTLSGAFFTQPAIVREEALFQGVDRLLSANGGLSREIRRANIRRFSEGAAGAVDCGPVQLRQEAGNILISEKENSAFEKGFALLIKAPGSYTVKKPDVIIDIREYPENGSAVVLPLVVRSCYRSDYIEQRGRKKRPSDLKTPGPVFAAVDSLGVAAFIGAAGVLLSREDAAVPAAHNGKRYITAHGGI